MASIKVKFRPSAVAGHEGTIYFQIIHERKVRQLLSDHKVFPAEWDDKRSMVTSILKNERIRRDVERLTRIDCRLSAVRQAYTADDVIDEFRRYVKECSLVNFMESVIARLRMHGRVRTSETYRSTLNSFRKFLAGKAEEDGDGRHQDMMLDCLTPETMAEYEAWLRNRGVVSNTVSFYNRILRAVYNRAVDAGVVEDRHPFRKVHTGVDKTVKRAVPIAVVRTIKAMDLSQSPSLDFARDMFMMSFYLRGMSFIDMAFLRKTDLRDGYVSYRRRKTGRQLVIKWTREMQKILDKYPENESCYLLPVIRRSGISERCAYRNAGYSINHNLKRVAGMAGLSVPLTLYVARHSWASAARAKGIPLPVISEGMGHDCEATTRIYLASLDTSLVDRANSLILASL